MRKCRQCGKHIWFFNLKKGGLCEKCAQNTKETNEGSANKAGIILFSQEECRRILRAFDVINRSALNSSVRWEFYNFSTKLTEKNITEQDILDLISSLKRVYLPKEIAEDALYGEEYNKLLDSLIDTLNFKINKRL